MTSNIIKQFENALDRTGISKVTLAQEIHISQSAMSNWSARGSIPELMLIRVAKVIGEYRFKLEAGLALVGLKIVEDKSIEDTPQAHYFSTEKEADDRKRLDNQILLVLSKRRGARTMDDREAVERYVKELSEQIGSEQSYLAAILEDWDLEGA
ncbi:helix-turn-helix domain-containing protein [Lacticaseibacillus mingshuiensis]|uniref:Helix-turn-helix domain-containing protein n=1 Tax=Lacticaseibacillus mingshuiensis TaxID=2799574 RepID=A0ABW4CLT5_9LACO|nr:helix-turn-helix domain-containing protein [Lacticaseibacillus mingshuiensis]